MTALDLPPDVALALSFILALGLAHGLVWWRGRRARSRDIPVLGKDVLYMPSQGRRNRRIK